MSTSLRFDHVVVVVRDLEAATRDYRDLGFTVFYGGQHTGGATHNALIILAEGGYLELLAPTDPAFLDILQAQKERGELASVKAATTTSSRRFLMAMAVGEGLGLYALYSPNLDSEVADARSRGLYLHHSVPGGRTRADGQLLRWRSVIPDDDDLPYLLQDDTPRSLRVPPDQAEHANGALGLADLTVLVPSLDDSLERYRALLGVEPQRQPGAPGADFSLDTVRLHLTQPTDDAMADYLTRHGPGPYALRLRAGQATRAGALDPTRTHNTPITLIH